jgi:folate-binding protein YgfZ
VKAFTVARDVLEVTGPDATDFLQGQLSQDIADLQPGGSAWSFLLQPQGKVDALLRVTRRDADRWILDVDGDYGDAVKARLERFKLRVKCDIDPLPWQCIALRGGGVVGWLGDALALDAAWPLHNGYDLLGPSPAPPSGVQPGTEGEYERLRIEAGWPRMGTELNDKTIPTETGLVPRTVSFTKGCFTGQELVARIDSRGGNVPRHLRGLALQSEAPVGASVVVDEKQVGEVTSVAGDRALAYVGRAVEPPADATVTWEGGSVGARIESLPIVR